MSDRKGCSIRPFGCLALLLLCGLCSWGTVNGVRQAVSRDWIEEPDLPDLPDIPAIDELRMPELVFPTAEPTNEESEEETPEARFPMWVVPQSKSCARSPTPTNPSPGT